MCMDEMKNNKEDAKMGRDLADGTTPYSVSIKICL